MSKWIQLSYPLSEATPSYGNGRSLEIVFEKSIDKGDSCNTSVFTMPNHLGTHIDAPFHFDQYGKSITDFAVDFWIINFAYLVNIEVNRENPLIDDVSIDWGIIPNNIELLLLKTGYCHQRNEPSYWERGPIISPVLADKIRDEFPEIRMLGVDTISISSWKNRETGRKAHVSFLVNERPILLLEDVNLSEVDSSIKFNKIVISPLMIQNSNGAPCTVFAEIE